MARAILLAPFQSQLEKKMNIKSEISKYHQSRLKRFQGCKACTKKCLPKRCRGKARVNYDFVCKRMSVNSEKAAPLVGSGAKDGNGKEQAGGKGREGLSGGQEMNLWQ